VKREAAAIFLAMIFPSAAAWLYFVELAQPAGTGANPFLQTCYSGSKILQFSFPLIWFWAAHRRLPRPGAPSTRGLGLGIAFGLIVCAAMLALYFFGLRGSSLMEQARPLLQAKVAEFGLNFPLGFVLLGSFLSIIHSLLEEYYWRWFIFGELKRLLHLRASILLSALAFMGHHVIVLAVYFPGHFVTAALPFSLGIAVGGAFWAWLYHRSGSIYAIWASHLLIDSAIMIIGYDLLFGV